MTGLRRLVSTSAFLAFGRIVTLLLPLIVLGRHSPDERTDAFFLLLASSFFFSATLPNAWVDAVVPQFARTPGMLFWRAWPQVAWLIGTTFALVWGLLGPLPKEERIGYALGGALLVSAGFACVPSTARFIATSRFVPIGLTTLLRLPVLIAYWAITTSSRQLALLLVGLGIADWLRVWLLRRMATRGQRATLSVRSIPWRQLGWSALVASIGGLSPIVVRLVAKLDGPEAISLLDLAERLYLMLGSVCAVGFGPLILAHLAQDPGNEMRFRHALRFAWLWGGGLAVVGGVIGWLLLPTVLSALLVLSSNQAQQVIKIYLGFVLGLPAFAAGLVLVRRLIVRAHWRLLVSAAIFAFVTIVVLALAFRPLLGPLGIALAAASSYWVAAFVMWIMIRVRT
jgi:peptidoglycan biosynthesis protein MviN/MurJ (putative lipid II flippase)